MLHRHGELFPVSRLGGNNEITGGWFFCRTGAPCAMRRATRWGRARVVVCSALRAGWKTRRGVVWVPFIFRYSQEYKVCLPTASCLLRSVSRLPMRVNLRCLYRTCVPRWYLSTRASHEFLTYTHLSSSMSLDVVLLNRHDGVSPFPSHNKREIRVTIERVNSARSGPRTCQALSSQSLARLIESRKLPASEWTSRE